MPRIQRYVAAGYRSLSAVHVLLSPCRPAQHSYRRRPQFNDFHLHLWPSISTAVIAFSFPRSPSSRGFI
ncbi:hypothetical protein A0H81_02159 [Grifola frondosa]|uniref:Uncharacterized protein n=1 Tax=Grifola frondosa TaxID=5627 RepID=A0A1C7MLU0_GRIFR|nr:hypothetical protein A0H81_02159 [Grifola frondosa]